MVIRRLKHYWKTNQVKKFGWYSFFLFILAALPSISLAIYYGYNAEDGLVHRALVPGFVTYILMPISIVLCIPLNVLAFTGLYASVFEKDLSKQSLVGGIVLFLILIITTIGPKIARDFLL